MSIFDTLAESGVTQEDLEKAASARLFAEAAATEGIDLSQLSEDQAEELYALWADDSEKNASADEFINAAASEGIDLNELTEDQVGELYNYWATGGEEKVASAEELLKEAAVNEATAKLAEAEYIGRYMARVYSDEMNKIAAEGDPSMWERAKGLPGKLHGHVGGLGERLGAEAGKGHLRGYGALGAGTLAAGGLAYGGKKLLDRRKAGAEKQSSIDDLIEERALEMLKEAADEEAKKSFTDRLKGAGGAVHGAMGTLGEKASFGKLTGGKAKALGYGITGAGTLAAGYGAKKLMSRNKGGEGEKQSSAFDAIVEERALELLKEAADAETKKSFTDRLKGAGNAVHGAMGTVGEKASFGKLTGGKAKALGYGLTTAGAGGLAYGGKKLHSHMKAKREAEKQSSIDDVTEARALEMIEEAQFAEDLDEAALELLAASGY
jgi:hypothetical protein